MLSNFLVMIVSRHLGREGFRRGKTLWWVANEGGDGDGAAFQIGLERRPLDTYVVGLCQCLSALSG
jgi:hypothetical protein